MYLVTKITNKFIVFKELELYPTPNYNYRSHTRNENYEQTLRELRLNLIDIFGYFKLNPNLVYN